MPRQKEKSSKKKVAVEPVQSANNNKSAALKKGDNVSTAAKVSGTTAAPPGTMSNKKRKRPAAIALHTTTTLTSPVAPTAPFPPKEISHSPEEYATPLSTMVPSPSHSFVKKFSRAGEKDPALDHTKRVGTRSCPGCWNVTLAILLILVVAKMTGADQEVVKSAHEQLIPVGLLVEDLGRPGLTYYSDYPRDFLSLGGTPNEEAQTEEKKQQQSEGQESPERQPNAATSKKHRRKHAHALHPVVVIPGFLGTALEVWETEECLKSNLTSSFRQRIFSTQMIVSLLQNPSCFLRHLSLGPNGEDPEEDIRIRPAEGLDASDYIVPGFWIWAKIFINLVDIEVEPSQLHIAGFDWRLDPEMMQVRDGYFSKLKHQIEFMVERSTTSGGQGTLLPRKKAVVAAHSYGALVFTAFTKWIEEGNDQTQEQKRRAAEASDRNTWMDDHVEAFYNMGGPLLGLPKATSGSLSGEFRDTAMLPATAKLLVNSGVPLRSRANVFRSWPCLRHMQPRIAELFPSLVTLRNENEGGNPNNRRNLTLQESYELLGEVAGVSDQEDVQRKLHVQATGNNDLPLFPKKKVSFKVFCVRGVGYPTEVGFHYRNISLQKPARAGQSLIDLASDLGATNLANKILSSSTGESLQRFMGTGSDGEEGRDSSSPSSLASDTSPPTVGSSDGELRPNDRFYELDPDAPNHAVQEDSGDATVPLMSLGYLCHSKVVGWRTIVDDPDQNIISVEVQNHNDLVAEGKHAPRDPRGGDYTGDHVDMLGNKEVIIDLLHIVSGQAHLVKEKIVSDIINRTAVVDAALEKRLGLLGGSGSNNA